MNRSAELNGFLATVERRAFNLARFAVGNQEDALDIVQDSMFALVRRYGNRPREEWQPLFYRILQRRITDHHRRGGLRRRLFGWMGSDAAVADDAAIDGVADPGDPDPATRLERDGAMAATEAAIRSLPLRQQQAFLLRQVEGLSVAETAAAMGCSEGSVKTHHARAVETLRARLEDHWT